MPPGVEVNSIGYWQVSYPRLRYVVNGQEHSYAFSSMISWRGQWYVVHLGPNWRPGAGGWVCTPAAAHLAFDLCRLSAGIADGSATLHP